MSVKLSHHRNNMNMKSFSQNSRAIPVWEMLHHTPSTTTFIVTDCFECDSIKHVPRLQRLLKIRIYTKGLTDKNETNE